jgi:hypothetical protein
MSPWISRSDVERDDTDQTPAVVPAPGPDDGICDVCGSDRVSWRSCKLLCLNCGTILKSCADL